ncbi:glucokinase [Natronospirillum operosum]|uniref:Glucokinase n=1 Tax=Natronospirillum operosum TaxID=2759953 RepID=A0A4Z0WHD5_9GAMM|nr:glucokinase [Natronospirillum operosum]TGG95347.1 glucokinase [Natronospirillum operosum]
MTTEYGLIADIGGTNARFALAPRVTMNGRVLALSEQDLVAQRTLNGRDHETIGAAIEAYLDEVSGEWGRPDQGCLAIACPTDQDLIRMTNHTWAFSVSELQAALGFRQLRFINDYHALANSIPYLGAAGAVQVGGGEPAVGAPMAVTGPGTGLGLACLAFSDIGPVTVQTEGGHAHFAPTDDIEIQVLSYLLQSHERVSWERLLSGMGLENLYRALCHVHGETAQDLKAPDISQAGLSGQDPRCEETLQRFCALLGSYAGDVALSLGARGGVFIAGGIIPRFMDFFQASQFRQRFEAKGRMSGFNQPIPTAVIVSQQPGLLGSAAVLNYDWARG